MDGLKLINKLREERGGKAKRVSNSKKATEEVEVSVEPADRALWDADALLVRRLFKWKTDRISVPFREASTSVRRWEVGGRTLKFLEDPMGTFQAGNGATLW